MQAFEAVDPEFEVDHGTSSTPIVQVPTVASRRGEDLGGASLAPSRSPLSAATPRLLLTASARRGEEASSGLAVSELSFW